MLATASSAVVWFLGAIRILIPKPFIYMRKLQFLNLGVVLSLLPAIYGDTDKEKVQLSFSLIN
jgi:hypothetical protein